MHWSHHQQCPDHHSLAEVDEIHVPKKETGSPVVTLRLSKMKWIGPSLSAGSERFDSNGGECGGGGGGGGGGEVQPPPLPSHRRRRRWRRNLKESHPGSWPGCRPPGGGHRWLLRGVSSGKAALAIVDRGRTCSTCPVVASRHLALSRAGYSVFTSDPSTGRGEVLCRKRRKQSLRILSPLRSRHSSSRIE